MASLELAGLLHLTILPLSLLAMSLTSTVDPLETDFSSNAHTPNPNLGAFATEKSTEFEIPSRHPDLCFVDGSVALLCGHQYFLVHHSLLSLHSPVLKQMVEASVKEQTCHVMEGRPTARILQSPGDMLVYLKAIYGLYRPKDLSSFTISSVLLKLATTYETVKIRNEVLRSLQESWPSRLDQWEVREKNATDSDGVYAPRTTMAHPILIIKLAREVNAPELLPSAFYDLSRFLPSQLSAGYTDADTGEVHYLTQEDLFRVFRGKEQAARYFSTFIVKELEGRTPSEFCHNRNEINPGRKRRCQVAYEAVTYALIRDVNGLVLNRNSDPLYAISDSLLMQTRDDMPGADNRSTHRACEACRMEYAAVVEAIREEFWRRLPEWFDLEVSNWG